MTVFYQFQIAEFTFYRFLRSQQIGNLHIRHTIRFLGNKINLCHKRIRKMTIKEAQEAVDQWIKEYGVLQELASPRCALPIDFAPRPIGIRISNQIKCGSYLI